MYRCACTAFDNLLNVGLKNYKHLYFIFYFREMHFNPYVNYLFTK